MTDIIIQDMDEWTVFADANRDELESQCGSIDDALVKACQGGLTIGGGAAPLFFVSFVD